MRKKISTEEKLNRIHSAVTILLKRKEATDISIYDVAKEGGMATSTVYHHYPNIESLFQHLMEGVFNDFDKVLDRSIKPDNIHHWSDINRMVEGGYIQYYRDNVIAQKLILGKHTFTELTHNDVENDLIIGKRVEAIYRQYFAIPSLPSNFNIFAIALQVADKVYSLSYREHSCIEEEMAEEAVRLTEAYLGLYIPYVCPKI